MSKSNMQQKGMETDKFKLIMTYVKHVTYVLTEAPEDIAADQGIRPPDLYGAIRRLKLIHGSRL